MRSSNTSLDARMTFSNVARWLWIALSLAGTAHAMDRNRAVSQYIRERWGVEQGFPRGPVYAIGQSSDGYLWIGTQSGLVRFDGLNFRIIRDVPALKNGESVLGLRADREGNLWILLEAGLLRYRSGVFDQAKSPFSARITVLSLSNQGGLLLSDIGGQVAAYRQGKFEKIAAPGNFPRSPVLAIAQASDGIVWSGTRGAGLFRLDGDRATPVSDGVPDSKINCLLAGERGDLLVGTDTGMVRWSSSQMAAAGPTSLHQFQVLAMEHDRDGNIWAGTDSGGLLRINESGTSSLDPGERPREAVTALFEDREGSLWIGSANGIERLRDSAFVTYSEAEGLPSSGGHPLLVDSEGRLWTAPAAGGLWWVQDGRHGVVALDGLGRDVIYSAAGGQGELWLGRRRGGLTRLRTERGVFTAHTYTKADGLAQDSVFSVYQSRDGSIWAGTLSAGVSKFAGGRFTTYTSAAGLLSNTVSAILEGNDGTMWFATTGGLNSLSNGHWQGYTEKENLPSENVYCLLEDSTGVLWAGTAGGLVFRNAKGIQRPAGAPPSLREPILGIAEDRLGSLWISTSAHVLRVNREKLLAGNLGDGDVREYGIADGLRGVEGVRRQRSVAADAAGRIWFSLNHGISVVDPARISRNTAPAMVQVQSVSADGSDIAMRRSVHIAGGSRRITFVYAGLSLAAPGLSRYRYRLDGYDSNWSDSRTSRDAVYTNLGPGPYRFRVIASNPDGAWNGEESAIAFEVDPLVWQTAWFRDGVVLIFVGAVWAFYRYRVSQLAARLNLRFEERLAERSRIAQELHDTLLQGFLSASMQVHVATDGLSADSPAKPILTRAIQLMRQVTEEGRNAVRGLRSSGSIALNLEHAFACVQDEFAPSTAGALERPEFRVIVDGPRKSLHPLLRDDVYKIGREALLNAFRHARAKNVEVELKYSSKQFRVLVRDDGCGIEPQIVKSGRDGHWGLSGMRERAEQIGARLHVYSSTTAGTEVELLVPGEVAFQDYRKGRPGWFRKLKLRRRRENERQRGGIAHERSTQNPGS